MQPCGDLTKHENEYVPIRMEVCSHRLQWILIRDQTRFKSSAQAMIRDILPDTETFSNLEYNPYALLDSEATSLQQLLPCEDVSIIKDVLSKSLSDFQRKYIENKFPPPSKIHECYFNYHCTKGFQALVTKTHVHFEFPLLDLSRLCCPDIEYLVKILENSPIVIKFKFGIPEGASNASMHFPSVLITSKTVDFPSFNDKMGVRDYLSLVENILSMKLLQRRNFALEFRKIAAVLEFDAVDFSYVSFAVRMRSASMFSLCVVELRLPGSFPESLPLVSVHDMASETSYPLDSAVFSQINRQLGVEVLAKEMLRAICKQIFKQAFQ